MTRLPRVVVAAAASGQGKTTIAVGLMAALTARGLTVAGAKTGPDYIDPGYHGLATGRPGRNLDPWLTPEELVAPLLLHAASIPSPADLAVIEGVMGLFDGRIGTDGFSSTAHVARLVDAPVLLVIDISSAARTVAAVVRGLADFDPAVRVAGVILNKAGSPRHATEVRRAVEAAGLPVLGVLPRDAGVSVPSRHLGLIPAGERHDAAAALDRLAEQTDRFLDCDAVVDLARTAPDLDATAWSPTSALGHAAPDPAGPRPVVAMAGGRAFTFRYAETEELLRAAGCEPVTFDPEVDPALPPGTRGLYLGGGFPEAHTATLSGNTRLRSEIRDAVAAGLPTVAECAGLLYLAETLDDHPMVGAVPARATMHPRLTLGYRTADLAVDGVLGPAGTRVHGHEFHRTVTDPPSGETGAWEADGTTVGFALDPSGTGRATVHASYLHVHWAGNPVLAGHFADAARRFDPAGAPGPSRPRSITGPTPAPVPSTADPSSTNPLDHHGDAEIRDDGRALLDLAVNVRSPHPPTWLRERLASALDELGAYPDTREARRAIARRHGVPEIAVLPTNGAAEAFSLIATAVDGRHPLVVHPQFTEPEAALRRAGRVPARHILRAETGFVLDPDAVDPAADLVLVGNPTNPTGVLHPKDVLRALRRPGRVLVVDEAFMDGVPGETESLTGEDLEDLLIVRSLTTTWGLAGLRAGYVLGDPRLIAALSRHQPPWSVSALAACAMTHTASAEAVREAEFGAARLGRVRRHLVSGLESSGLHPIPGYAPFVLVEAGVGVREALREAGVAVRRGDTFPGLGPGWIRAAVRTPEITEEFLGALGSVLDSLR